MYKIALAAVFIMMSFLGFSQGNLGLSQWKNFQVYKGDTINCVDMKGQKQGVWKKYYRNDTLCSVTIFKNNKPSDVSKTWYESGKLKAEVVFAKDQIHGKGVSYYESGHIMAKGNYIDLKKDSIWLYYGENDSLKSIELYSKGVATGTWKVFMKMEN
ncbi:MAG: hypothetical protein IPK10_01010 [Bacteroidetes bacterium]|nr:hypothetical protein [Bacteroidota bacterium]